MSIKIKLLVTASLLAVLAACASPPHTSVRDDPNRAGGAAGEATIWQR